jgi:type VI secretion system secreted protein Hcp
MAVYLKVPSITGDATAQDFSKWIRLHSLGFGSSRTVQMDPGRPASRAADAGYIGEMIITKEMDSASMNLFKAACNGGGQKMTINVTRAGTTGDKSEEVFLAYELEDALLAGYSFNSTGRNPNESLLINFAKVTMTYTGLDKKPIPVTLNAVTAENK